MPPPPEEDLAAGTWQGPGDVPGKREGNLAVGFGIAGILFGVLSIVALWFAAKGQRLADEAGVEAPRQVRTGRILAWVGLALWAIGIVYSISTSVTG